MLMSFPWVIDPASTQRQSLSLSESSKSALLHSSRYQITEVASECHFLPLIVSRFEAYRSLDKVNKRTGPAQ